MKIEYSKQLKTFITIWDKAINKNEKHAQFVLASFYLKLQTEAADKKAFDLYKKSAKQRYTEAMYALGKCYELGKGIRRNYFQAVQWYIRTDQNTTDDLINNPDPVGDAVNLSIQRYFEDEEWAECIDEMLENLQDEKEDSFEIDKMAAERGDAEAQNRLGHRYYHGQDTEQNVQKAFYWYQKSAEQGCEAGMQHLAEYYEKEKQYKEAAKWYRQYVEARIKWRNERLGW